DFLLRGEILRGLWGKSICLLGGFVYGSDQANEVQSAATSQAKLEQLKIARSTIIRELKKITTGKSPCFSVECQNQKFDIVSDLHSETALFPGAGKDV